MEDQELNFEIVRRMYEQDAFSQWLGIRYALEEGQVVTRLKVRPDMLNGFGIAHGGISYALADSALAFASNARGRQAVSVETSISHLNATAEGSELVARVRERQLKHHIAIYEIEVCNGFGELVALFKGTVYRSSKAW